MHGTVLNRLLIEKMHLTFFIFCVQFALRLGIRTVVRGIWCVGAGETSLRPKNSGNLVLYLLGNSSVKFRLVIKTFEKSSRPRPRPWPPGLETKTKTLATRSRDRDQDLGHQVSRPRPRPWPPGLETKTKTLVIRSRDQNLIIGHKYLCMCVYMYVCLYEGMCVCYIHNVCMYYVYMHAGVSALNLIYHS